MSSIAEDAISGEEAYQRNHDINKNLHREEMLKIWQKMRDDICRLVQKNSPTQETADKMKAFLEITRE